MRQLLVIAAIAALALLARAWLRKSGPPRFRWILYITAAALIVLAAFGKLHWIAAVAAAVAGALPAVLAKLSLVLRYAPLIGGLFSRAGYGKRGNARFESEWLRVEINPALGTLDGEVLQGEYRGRRLSAMSLAELEKLREALRGRDAKGALLLQSYVALRTRARGATGGQEGGTAESGGMTRNEALNVLGLKDGAAREDVIRAHKRLMQKMHPDRGGSSYLAAKINRAKEVLLEKR